MKAVVRRLARAVRGTDAYRWTRGKAVRWVRTSTAARRLAAAAGYGGERGLSLGRPFTGGTGIPAEVSTAYEPLLVVAVSLPRAELGALLERLQSEQIADARFRPVLLIAGEGLDLVRPFGFPVEVLVREEQWFGTGSWDAYVRRTVRRMTAAYGAASVMEVAGPAPLTAS